ncbi:MAG: Stp1/IreP family PP2C-type Ser/Thr phosphatase [Gemmatimonadetes bacterium]|nr:Stp1/IreP family PP2C-type Ser/Thr phosphatase [Gemmatimonadota bacterium]
MTDTSAHGDIVVHVFGRTDVGRTREHNEDCFVVADLTTMNATLQPEVREHRPGQRGSLFMVADGMGGAAAGEVASQMATEVVLDALDQTWRNVPSTDADTFANALRRAVEAANTRIHRYAMDHPENRGMGTTTTIAGVLADRLYLCQVGDSRGYLVRNGTAIQVTKDQSLVQRLIDAGELTAEEAETSERRNIILQALGPEGQVKVDLTTQQVRRGDVLVLCSDGMSGQMRSADIARIVTEQAPDLMATCKALIDLANENGGPDNITVIVARFEGEGLEPPVQGDFVGHQPYVSPAEARATLPVSAATIEQSMQDAALLEMSLVTTAETEIPVAPNHEAASGARSTTPIAPPPSAPAATPRLTVEQQRQVRVVFIGVTVLVTAWLIWAYLLKG